MIHSLSLFFFSFLDLHSMYILHGSSFPLLFYSFILSLFLSDTHTFSPSFFSPSILIYNQTDPDNQSYSLTTRTIPTHWTPSLLLLLSFHSQRNAYLHTQLILAFFPTYFLTCFHGIKLSSSPGTLSWYFYPGI